MSDSSRAPDRLDDLADRVAERVERGAAGEGASTADRLLYLAVNFRLVVYLALIGPVLLLVTEVGPAVVPELPRWLKIDLLIFSLGVIPAFVAGKVLVADRFIPDPRLHVAEFSLSPLGVYVHKVSRERWNTRDTGEQPALRLQTGAVDWVVTELEELDDGLRVEGCNPELADPISVAARDGMLRKTFGDLVERVEQLQRRDATAEARVVGAEQEHVMALLRAFEDGAAFDPEGFREAWSADDLGGEDRRDAADRRGPRDDGLDLGEGDDRRTVSDLLEASSRAVAPDGGEET